jgi:hypothetical protein
MGAPGRDLAVLAAQARLVAGSFPPDSVQVCGDRGDDQRFQDVRINAALPLQRRAKALVAKAGADLNRVTFYNHPTNDAWCRDHGPIFVKNDRTGEVALTDWKYNAWGDKYPPYSTTTRSRRASRAPWACGASSRRWCWKGARST